MPIGLPIIVSVTDLDPTFYGEDPHPPSEYDRLGPDRDARMIADLFVDQKAHIPGMELPMLLGGGPLAGRDGLPTRSHLTTALEAAANRLQAAGDTLFLYYSGHGARLAPGAAGPGARDALCLLDGFFLDVELVALWHRFAPTARVVVFADCCHAGDIATTSLWDRLLRLARRLVGDDPRGGSRSLFDDTADEIATRKSDELNRLFTEAAAGGGTDVNGIPCSLLTFAASDAEELLRTADGESPFALTLVTDYVLNRNSYRGYKDLAEAVTRDIEATDLHPSLVAAGRIDHPFEDSTPPFTV